FLGQLLQHDDDAALGLVVLHADRADVPGEGERGDGPVALGGLDVGREVVEQGHEVLAQGGHLLLLAPEEHEGATRPPAAPPARKNPRSPGGPSAPGQKISARGKSYDSPTVTRGPARRGRRWR